MIIHIICVYVIVAFCFDHIKAGSPCKIIIDDDATQVIREKVQDIFNIADRTLATYGGMQKVFHDTMKDGYTGLNLVPADNPVQMALFTL